MNSANTQRVRRALLRWYRLHARPFPWRRTRDPYRVLVSEVMLQQTQASRVVPFYRAFLRRFPSVRSLASASPGRVIRAWQGLGYNMRALRLHATAATVDRQMHGMFPSSVEGLMDLPGIGPYTARAVAVFAFGRPEAVVDTNVRRILRRLFPRTTDRSNFQALADRLLARRAPYDWNQAVMELGATVCTPVRPRCDLCPIATFCPSAGKAVRVAAKRKHVERRYQGQPHRIYRGRVLKMLHVGRGIRALTEGAIVREVFGASHPAHRRFIRNIIGSLQRDGLVDVRSNGREWKVAPRA